MLTWCSGCENMLPRQSFLSKGRWPHKSDADRKCVNCRKERYAPDMNEGLHKLAWCSGCKKQLPRQSFVSEHQWRHTSNAKRKCLQCHKEQSAPGMWKCVQCLEAKPKEHAFELWKNRSGSMKKREKTRCDVCVRKNDQAQLVVWGLVEASEE